MKNPPGPDELKSSEQLLAQILQRSSSAQGPLPFLKAEKSLIEKYYEALQEWVNNWLKVNTHAPPLNPGTLKILGYLALGFVAMSVGSLLFWLIWHLFTNNQPRREVQVQTLPVAFTTLEEKLLTLLKQALESGNFSRAARVRWQLFLLHKEQPVVLTPHELMGQLKLTGESWQETMSEQYLLMFAPRLNQLSDFERGEQSLRRFETPESVQE